jgi:hypothetical protein
LDEDEREAYEAYSDALEAWESGDTNAFYDNAAQLNEWMQDEGYGPLMPEDWYPDDAAMQDAMWDWIDTLSHEDREEFFGY